MSKTAGLGSWGDVVDGFTRALGKPRRVYPQWVIWRMSEHPSAYLPEVQLVAEDKVVSGNLCRWTCRPEVRRWGSFPMDTRASLRSAYLWVDRSFDVVVPARVAWSPRIGADRFHELEDLVTQTPIRIPSDTRGWRTNHNWEQYWWRERGLFEPEDRDESTARMTFTIDSGT